MARSVDTYQDTYLFEGLEDAAGTLFPNVLLDQVMAHLTGAEFKVLAYLVRRTMGLTPAVGAISLEHICSGVRRQDGAVLDAGTGLSKKTAIAALKGLQEKGVIVSCKGKSSQPTGFALHVQPRAASDGPCDTTDSS